jgi:2-methylcitrate dehydratase PrpD
MPFSSGSGVSETGNEVEAREQAVQKVKEQIMDYIGVSVTSVTSGAVAASLG